MVPASKDRRLGFSMKPYFISEILRKSNFVEDIKAYCRNFFTKILYTIPNGFWLKSQSNRE